MKKVQWMFPILLLCSTPIQVIAACSPMPPTTGLGDCVDFITSGSSTLTNQVGSLGYSIQYGGTSYTDYVAKKIVVPSYICSPDSIPKLYNTVATLAHELGHAEHGVREDTSSRDAYIKSWCDNEGYAVINNIKGRDEIFDCSANSADIGVVASNRAQLISLYEGGGGMTDVGKAFCESNTTSTTGQSYLDFYGDYYDKHYP